MSIAGRGAVVPYREVKTPALLTSRSPKGNLRSGARFGRTRRAIAGWLLTREALVNLLLVAVMVSVVWGSIALHLMQQQREVNWRAERESGNLAQAAAESMGQTVASVDDALRFMRAIFLADPAHFDIIAWSDQVNQARGIALEFALLGRDGRLLADSLGPVAAPAGAPVGDFADQDFFRAHLADPTDRLFISRPIAGHAPGRWSVLLTRRIAAADGWFMGVIAASVDPSWLTRLHRSLDIGRGMVMLVGTDGRVRAIALGARSDRRARYRPTDRSGWPARRRTQMPRRGTTRWWNPLDKAREIVSFQRLPNADAYVVVGLDRAKSWRPIGSTRSNICCSPAASRC